MSREIFTDIYLTERPVDGGSVYLYTRFCVGGDKNGSCTSLGMEEGRLLIKIISYKCGFYVSAHVNVKEVSDLRLYRDLQRVSVPEMPPLKKTVISQLIKRGRRKPT